MKYSILILTILTVCISCKTKKNLVKTNIENHPIGDNPKIATTQNGATDGIWILQKINGETDPQMARVNMEINTAKKSVNGNDGCNSYSGSLIIENQSIECGTLDKTERECIVPAPFADDFYRRLQQISIYSYDSYSLLLSDSEGQVLLEFIRKEEE